VLPSCTNQTGLGISLPDFLPLTQILKQEQKVVAGRLIVYNRDPESYVTFISPEACEALDKYLEFRKEHAENVKNTSPLFRDSSCCKTVL
jgi:hypothetical protein